MTDCYTSVNEAFEDNKIVDNMREYFQNYLNFKRIQIFMPNLSKICVRVCVCVCVCILEGS